MLTAGLVWGAVLGAAVTAWVARRIWRNARWLSARARGQDHLAELGRLAGGLAHEIKNPLSTITLNLRLLSEDVARHHDDEHRRWGRRLESVQTECDRLRTILDDFLRYAGKLELVPVPLDLRRLASEVVDFFAAQAENARVVLRSSFPPEPVACRVDERLMKQALLNLMINAVQAMEDGGELLVQASTQRGEGILEVIDTGRGMDADELGRVFEVYYSTKKNGTGLGLPTTRRIVRAHGGTLRVESEPGKGTRFVIALPLLDTGPA